MLEHPDPVTALTDTLDRLATALTGRYRLDRQLGRGGMAVVYVAHDLRHDRRVALKVLRPDLAATLGAERFLREIRFAARLQHPHILPVLDSGEIPAEGMAPLLLWYSMPLVQGESLRDRLRRQGQQPLDDTVRWTLELADALAYAHGQGIIHRDIKPENVLLDAATPAHALLADFGVARAFSAGQTVGSGTREPEGDGQVETRLTETGMALGTPAYMSPEQSLGDATLDGRSDLYSLGCVLYELLTGEPPYTGPTAQAIVAKRLTDPVPSARRLRDTVPAELDSVLQRLLARSPADRFATAGELTAALRAPPTAATVPTAAPVRRVRARVLWSAGLALGIVALLGLVVARRAARGSALRLDPTAVAVLPFRITGPDRSLDYLGEGIVDLLAVKLDGSTGPHAVPPRLLLGNLGYRQGMEVSSDAGEAAARESGAGLMVDGSLVRSGASLELSATLRRTDGSGAPVRATASGSLDSFPALVDRLAAQLLAGHGGTTTALGELSSSRAIAEYLQAKAALRRGKYVEALRHYDAALDADSTFALAALEAMPAWTRVDSRGVTPRARRLAWTYRAKLSPKGQALLKAWLGANYPGPTSMLLDLAGWQDAVREAPDVADAWFELGDRQLHFGALNDVARAAEDAEGNFHRAIELDSGYVMPLEHLLLAKWYLEDTTEVRALGRLWSAQDTASADRADYMRWRLAVALGDSAMVARQRARLGRWPEESLDWLTAVSQADGIGLGDAELGFAERRRRAVAGDELRYVQVARHDWLLNAGRPTEALAIVDSLASGEPYPDWSRLQRVDDALFGDGDTAAAAAAVRELSTRRAPRVADSLRRAVDARTACRLGLWALGRSDVAGVRTRVRTLRLQRLTELEAFNDDDRLMCADLLEAWLAGTGDRARARSLLDRADSLYLNSNTLDDWPVTNLVTARLRELIGDSPGARRVIARVPIEVPYRPLYQSTYQREQARLVLAAGDTAAAIRALRRYVALRASPEPALVPQRDSARAQLAALIGR